MDFLQFSAADMENFGDVLYPMVLRLFAEAHGHHVLDHYAFLPDVAPLGGGYVTKPVKDLFASPSARRRCVIGGGDILRLDDEVVAGHYHRSFERPVVSFARRASWTTPTPAQTFRARRMPPTQGAFMLSQDNCPGVDKVAYFSAGVPFNFPEQAYPMLRQVFDAASFIYVRDEGSAEKLRRVGISARLLAAPDFIIGIDQFFPLESLRAGALRMLALAGQEPSRPYLCFQCSEAIGSLAIGPVAHALAAFSAESGLDVVLLPLGPCHNDHIALAKLAALSGGRFRLAQPQTVEDMLAVLAHSSLFAGVSMHGNICARAYGIPHLFGALTGVDKIQGAMHMLQADPGQRIVAWSELGQGLRRIARLDRSHLLATARDAFARASDATQSMLQALA